MPNIRELIETDLGTTIEGDFALPVELVAPDGSEQTLTGDVRYDTVTADPETGMEIITNEPNVSLRRSSLTKIPVDGENWVVRIPTTPSTTDALEDFFLSKVRPQGGGRSIGFIKLYLTKAVQL